MNTSTIAMNLDGYGHIVSETFKVPEELKKKVNTHHIWLIDVSGSMWSKLSSLREDIQTKVTSLPAGDTITLGYFSGRKQYKIFLTGHTISDASKSGLNTLIQENLKAIGMTCFSEILTETAGVLSTLKMLAPTNNFELMFFTDGYPTVNPYEAEIKSIFKAITELKSQLTSALLVGYGEDFNRELMGEMSSALGGSMVYSNDLPEFSKQVNSYLADVSGFGRKVELISSAPNAVLAFMISGSSVMLLDMTDGKVSVPVLSVTESQTVHFLVKGESTNRTFTNDWENSESVLYAAALLFNQRCKTQDALKMLGYAGDVALINRLRNAFTNEEYTEAESMIRSAVTDKSARYLEGKNKGYLPDDNAFCLLDAIETIMADEHAAFYPTSKLFSYKRVGAAREDKEEVSTKFTAKQDVPCRFSGLTWNSSALNLSVYTKIPGTVNLDEAKTAELGLASVYPCFVHRNFTIVSDGKPNMPTIPMRMQQKTYEILRAAGMIKTPWISQDEIYVVHLSAVPVINFAIANRPYKAVDLGERVYEDLVIGGRLKVLKSYLAEFEKADAELAPTTRSEAQVRFLLENFIDEDGAYNPPQKAKEPTDVRHINSFEIKLKGLSSLPSLNAVKQKMAENRKLTPADTLVAVGIRECEDYYAKCAVAEARRKWLEDSLEDYKAQQRAIRKDIQRTKFAIILGKTWFTDLPVRQDQSVVTLSNSIPCTLALSKEEVHI